MRRFVPLIYRCVRPQDDIDRTGGGTYSPGARDFAQEFRNSLLERFVAVANPATETVLEAFLTEPDLAHLGDYIRHLLDKHVEQFSEGPAWRMADIRIFARDYERAPQSDRDLFRIGLHRLGDLKAWVERGENSPREEVHPDGDEMAFRRWLARRLDEQAKCRYSVPQEWEIDGKARPDLRLTVPGITPLSLELKIADRWSVAELLAGLRDQLVGTYLRDDNARYGIYVLALFNHDRWWKATEDQSRLDSADLLLMLQRQRDEILRKRPDIAGLEIVLIDFSPPP